MRTIGRRGAARRLHHRETRFWVVHVVWFVSHWEHLMVTAIDCTGCKETILRALRGIDGVQRATADHLGGTVAVLVDGDVSAGELRTTLERLGYDASG